MSEVVTRSVEVAVIAGQEELVEEGFTGGAVVARRTQRGMVSAEWAVGLIAAIAVAGVLLAVVTNGAVRNALLGVILKIIGTMAG